MVVEIGLQQVLVELAARKGPRLHAGIHAGLVQGERIKRGEHAQIGQDGRVVFPVAVAVGGDIDDKRDVETRTAIHYRLGVFRHALVQKLVGREIPERDGVEVTRPEATAAADAIVFVDAHLFRFLVKVERFVGAFLQTGHAGPAFGLVDGRLAAAVLLGLAGP
jgi:hypothetical protein